MTEQPPITSLIATAREARGWSRARLADEMGVTESSVRSWESGRYLPPAPKLAQLVDLLKLDAAAVLAAVR
jgi:ribosome-binding protein aMBF1 (putative translation factor)